MKSNLGATHENDEGANGAINKLIRGTPNRHVRPTQVNNVRNGNNKIIFIGHRIRNDPLNSNKKRVVRNRHNNTNHHRPDFILGHSNSNMLTVILMNIARIDGQTITINVTKKRIIITSSVSCPVTPIGNSNVSVIRIKVIRRPQRTRLTALVGHALTHNRVNSHQLVENVRRPRTCSTLEG